MIDLKPACGQLIDLMNAVPDGQLTNPTPCPERTVGALFEHLDEVARGAVAVARPQLDPTGSPDTAPGLRDGWRERVATQVRQLGEAWDDPAAWHGSTDAGGLALPNEVWAKIALTELVVHGWDIARSTGVSFDLPETTLRACLDHVAQFVPNAPVPQLWGPAQPVADDAALIDRIVAITGRDPNYGRPERHTAGR